MGWAARGWGWAGVHVGFRDWIWFRDLVGWKFGCIEDFVGLEI